MYRIRIDGTGEFAAPGLPTLQEWEASGRVPGEALIKPPDADHSRALDAGTRGAVP